MLSNESTTAADERQDPALYPRPAAPLYPVLSAGSFFSNKRPAHDSIMNAGSVVRVISARMGIALALQHMDLQKGQKVLIPAYHCNSMVEPVTWASGKPEFYRVREDASADFDDVAARIDSDTRALMITHYFGFPQNVGAFRELCDERGIALIEDCAHVIFGGHQGVALGSLGDYTVCSPMKLLPIFDGGWLISSRHRIHDIPQQAMGAKFSINACSTVIGRSLSYGRMPWLRLIYEPVRGIRSIARRFGGSPAGLPQAAQTPLAGHHTAGLPGEFDPALVNKRMSATSSMLMRLLSKSRVIEKRRENYALLLEAFGDLPGAKPLFPELPEGVVPYLFPLVVSQPEIVFPRLKRQGVPISRFGEYLNELFDPASCPVAVSLSRSVLQFPCHQELTSQEKDSIIDKVTQELEAAR